MTDQEPKQEELQKFWEWCGFTFIYGYDNPNVVEESRSPFGERINPALTLDNLFRFAVPKLREEMRAKGRTIESISFEDNEVHILWWTGKPKTDTYGVSVYTGKSIKPEVALFRAIQETIK